MTRQQAEQFLANFGLSSEIASQHLSLFRCKVIVIAANRWYGAAFANVIGSQFTPAGKEKGGYFFNYPTEKQLPNLILRSFERGK